MKKTVILLVLGMVLVGMTPTAVMDGSWEDPFRYEGDDPGYNGYDDDNFNGNDDAGSNNEGEQGGS